MKVIVSIDQIKQPLTGVGRYTYELVSELSRLPQIESLRYFRGAGFDTELVRTQGHSGRLSHLGRRLLAHYGGVDLYRKISAYRQSRALRGYEDYIFHGASFYLPPFGGRSVVTVHDLSPFSLPACHPPERVRYLSAEVELSLRRASFLITDSEFTRREVSDYFGWPIDKICAIPLAAAAEFRSRGLVELAPPLRRLGLAPGGYSLFVGTIEPRKNIMGLLDAYESLPDAVRRRWPLILTGYRGWNSETIHARIVKAEQAGWARYLGFVPAADLPLILAGARLFIFPSHYEGFGLPVLEAMASGVPVVCSNSSSLPEVAGEVAAMCEPQDVSALCLLISAGLEDEDWRASAMARGLERASYFTWQRCAAETVAAYKTVLGA